MKLVQKIFLSPRFRTIGLAAVGGVIFFCGIGAWSVLGFGPAPDYYIFSFLSLSLFLVALGSINVIKYKEIPRTGGLPSITGGWAVFGGVMALMVSSVGCLYSLYEVVRYILAT